MKKLLLTLLIGTFLISCQPSDSDLKDLIIRCESSNHLRIVDIENFEFVSKYQTIYSGVGPGTEYKYRGTIIYDNGKIKSLRNIWIFLADSGEIANCDEMWK